MHPIDIYHIWIDGLTRGQTEQEQVDRLADLLDFVLSVPAANALPEFERYQLTLKNARTGFAGVSMLSDALIAISIRLQQRSAGDEEKNSQAKPFLQAIFKRLRHE
ncbi:MULTISPECIES: hypothetical protein [Ralstonia solanacearum species complex]|uniref:hypothetical protein n=1 Tax=Ralstonia solanacearum species complex TaxID=3116862 RepID=UPI000E57F072|nr:hypothetical protein [Ralstonia solanacearum]BEU72573.1 hypothetical protein MAFF211271_21280 [Ralstonia pseudosolanacearum]AXV77428.1 hypothetical protein CJO76_10900 [Ralstonia solanacearum]AXV91448.1 hypothetical protein CJO79_10885 [Ralstonia solanacearum]AXW19572.1 hypothetical protein CJO85_10935 [Ralstonia solanacearum]AXW76344.1 hypothetical protein CJO97_10880 [Ralstonia solanacearum]